MSMQQKADYIYAIKGQIKVAIEGKKGSAVTGDFSTYPAEIDSLPTGSGGASGDMLLANSALELHAGDRLSDMTVRAPVNIVCSSGATATNLTVSGSGAELLSFEGVADSGTHSISGGIVIKASDVDAYNSSYYGTYVTFNNQSTLACSFFNRASVTAKGSSLVYLTRLDSATMVVSSGAYVKHVSMTGNYTSIVASAGGSAVDIGMSGSYGNMTVLQGGHVDSVFIGGNYGTARISAGGTAGSMLLSGSRNSMYVMAGGSADDITVGGSYCLLSIEAGAAAGGFAFASGAARNVLSLGSGMSISGVDLKQPSYNSIFFGSNGTFKDSLVGGGYLYTFLADGASISNIGSSTTGNTEFQIYASNGVAATVSGLRMYAINAFISAPTTMDAAGTVWVTVNLASGGRFINTSCSNLQLYAGTYNGNCSYFVSNVSAASDQAHYVELASHGATVHATVGRSLFSISNDTVQAASVGYRGSLGVREGVSAGNICVLSGGQLLVRSAGSAYMPEVSSGGVCYALASGYCESATISSGGSLVVSSGGTALEVYSANGAAVTSRAGAVVTYRDAP